MTDVNSRNINIQFAIAKWLSFKILKFISPEIKLIFRKLENEQEKITKKELDVMFNENCIQHSLLPTYTNIKIHDEAARSEEFVLKFRQNLIYRQINNLKEELHILRKDQMKSIIKLLCLKISPLRKIALLIFLRRLNEQNKITIQLRHQKKLESLYGGEIYFKQDTNNIINLSNISINREQEKILNLGMNTHLKEKFDHIKYKNEIEKTY